MESAPTANAKRKREPQSDTQPSEDADSAKKRKKDKKLKRQQWKQEKKKQKAGSASAAKEKKVQTADDDADMVTAASAKQLVDARSLNETEYYFAEGLRCVRPYYHKYRTNAKKRWFGRSVLEVYSEEFAQFSPEYYKAAIESGRITVRGQKVSTDCKIRNGDWVEHATHRHEKPVSAEPVRVVQQTEQLVVVSKPSSLPVHPVGRYRHNSLLYVLAKEHKLTNLHVVHRLDRATSGLIVFAKDPSTANELMNQFASRLVKKQYLARVIGRFPEIEQTVDRPVVCLSAKYAKFGCGSEGEGKEAKTVFRRLGYDEKSNTSLVLCLPQTGRTHQIRVHLQSLGHPIANDARYKRAASTTASAAADSDARSVVATAVSHSLESKGESTHTRDGWPAELSADEVTKLLQASADPQCAECADIKAFSFARKFPSLSAGASSGSATQTATTTATTLKSREFGHKSSVFQREDDSAEAVEGVEDEGELWLHAFSFTCLRSANANANATVSASSTSIAKTDSDARSADVEWSFAVPWPPWALEFGVPSDKV